jgi:hypothetical protein
VDFPEASILEQALQALDAVQGVAQANGTSADTHLLATVSPRHLLWSLESGQRALRSGQQPGCRRVYAAHQPWTRNMKRPMDM